MRNNVECSKNLKKKTLIFPIFIIEDEGIATPLNEPASDRKHQTFRASPMMLEPSCIVLLHKIHL